MRTNLDEPAQRIHKLNSKWRVDMDTGKPLERNRCELLMLVITELSEARKLAGGKKF